MPDIDQTAQPPSLVARQLQRPVRGVADGQPAADARVRAVGKRPGLGAGLGGAQAEADHLAVGDQVVGLAIGRACRSGDKSFVAIVFGCRVVVCCLPGVGILCVHRGILWQLRAFCNLSKPAMNG
jgi:hypothetical protein